MSGFKLMALTAATLILAAGPVVAGPPDEDVEAVKKTIEDSYIRGVHMDRDVEAFNKGFHEDFTMFILQGQSIRKMSKGEWARAIEESRKKDPSPPKHKTEWDFPMVDVTGDAAVAKVEVYRDGTQIFSDYMSLYRFDDGWKIVGKIYHDHRKK